MSQALGNAGVDHGKLKDDYSSLQNMSSQYADLAVEGGFAAAGALPPPFGTAADVAALGRSLWRGDWGGALLDAVGFIPVFGDGAKAAKIADRLNTLRRSLDVLSTGVARGFNKTKETALKYWDDIVKNNDAAYKAALRSCNGTKECLDAAALQKGPQYKNTPSQSGTWQPPEGRGDGVFTPNNGGPPITYKNGFPDYSSHVHTQTFNGVSIRSEVDIPMTGARRTDFRLADEAMGAQIPGWRRPPNHTWHHNEDGVTMQLIPSNMHGTGQGAGSPHMGGNALYGSGSRSGDF
ncbi:HNH endonuclease [Epibacterium sp. SM1979]|uniref:HNH endonuclease n=1 Tax=Tritonibacter litoralis TaxID=2662264 RepID=A0A843YFI3_9RHOB|nr:HNH endonuclease [Tritonibacter litoralis]MQQ08043.1 HNH endonuclease [Tritonibacter litoralis]